MKNISFSVAKRDKNFFMPYHEVHTEIELYYLKEGERLYFVENRTYHLSKGSSILIGSNRIHKTSSAGEQPHERMLLEVHPDLLHGFSSCFPGVCFDYLTSHNVVIVRPDNPLSRTIAGLFEEISDLYREKPFGYEEEIRCNTFKILLNFHRCIDDPVDEQALQSPKHQKIYEVTEYISAHMAEIESLDSLCSHFYISKYYLCHSFKEITGLSIMSFLNMTRVLRACVLLREDTMKIPQIAKAVGLGSTAHFTEVFKRIKGMTPQKYRCSSEISPWNNASGQ